MSEKITDYIQVNTLPNDTLFDVSIDVDSTALTRSIRLDDLQNQMGVFYYSDGQISDPIRDVDINNNILLIRKGRIGFGDLPVAGSESYLIKRFTLGESVLRVLGGVTGNDVFFDVAEDGKKICPIGGVFANTTPLAGFSNMMRGSNGDNYALGVYSNSSNLYGQTIEMIGNTSIGLNVATQGSPAGLSNQAVGVRAGIISNTGTASIHYGVEGYAYNASNTNVGVRGRVSNNLTFGSSINSGVRGENSPRINHSGYGGYFVSEQNNSSFVYTNIDMVGVLGRSGGSQNVGTTDLRSIGGVFEADNGNTNIAILVPNANNSGNVVFGSDDSSVNNSMLEVTGDIEVLGGSGNGVIITSPDSTRWKLSVDNAGVLSAVLA